MEIKDQDYNNNGPHNNAGRRHYSRRIHQDSKQQVINAKFQETVFLSAIIESTRKSSMREGNSTEVATIIENIWKNKEIVNLRIIISGHSILKSTIRPLRSQVFRGSAQS